MNVHCLTRDAEEFTANVFLLEGDRTVLIDAGAMRGITDAVREYVEELDAVVITHQHNDHIARLGEVVTAFDPTVYAFAEHSQRTEPLADGMTLELGDESFEVVHSPGHAPDHVSLVSDRTLISGDVVVYNDGAFDDGSFGRTDMAGQSRDRLVESLERLLTVMGEDVERLYAGHGDSFTGDVEEVVERALSRARRGEPKY